ncbi:SDR family NAD(P)-dependent oxidoreductase, partial [Kocuria sp. SM24M-10]|uniref:SDR family NAD(P)-dependent oxidoreductase n=1 Tax=Kocuria sp. SM24M-10 TaxID=1660349 RepID=UPI00128B0C96
EQFDETYKTNVYAMFWLCKAAVPHLPPGSAIINTSSIQGYQPAPILLDYASTKYAINGFSKSLAAQLAPKGIRFSAPPPSSMQVQVSKAESSRSALMPFSRLLIDPTSRNTSEALGPSVSVPASCGVQRIRGWASRRSRPGSRR